MMNTVVINSVAALPPSPHPTAPRSASVTDKHSVLWSFLAGGLTGAAETLLTYPAEYVKTHLQLQQLTPGASHGGFGGMWDCVATTVRQHSPLGLYRGMSPVLLGSMPKQASRWAAYDWATTRAAVWCAVPPDALGAGVVAACGFFAGAVEAICAVAPTETVKTRLIHDARRRRPHYAHLSTCAAVGRMLREHGIRGGLYRGLGTTMLKQGVNQSLRFPAQHAAMGWVCRGGREERRGSAWWNGLAGWAAGVLSVLATQPLDVVKTQLQAGRRGGEWGWVRCYKEVYKQRGVAGFYAGVVARSVHVGAHVALTFTVFPVVRRGVLAYGKKVEEMTSGM